MSQADNTSRRFRRQQSKRDAASADPNGHTRAMEPVTDGGSTRRIVFAEGARPEQREPRYQPVEPVRAEPAPEPAPDPEPAPEPAPAPADERPSERDLLLSSPRKHRSRWSIDEIHRAVDALHRKGYYGTPSVETHRRVETRTVYRTGGGAVRESHYPDPAGERRLLYLSRGSTALREDERFVSTMVDRKIRTVKEERSPAEAPIEAPAKRPAKAATKTKARPPAKPKTTAYYDFKGDIHPVVEIEGIGKTYEKKLHAMGIASTARLCFEDAAKIAKKVGAPTKTVRSWQAMAQLAKVNGIGPQYAEALARAGIGGIDDLKKLSAAKIADKVNKYLDGLETSVLGNTITAKRVETWKKNAADMRKVRQAIPES